MTNNKSTKQLSKALAVLVTLGSLFSFSAAPAMAYDNQWGVDVYVTDSTPEYDPCADFIGDYTAATWSPDMSVTYSEGQTNDVYVDDGSVPFSVGLNFTQASATNCNSDPSFYNPDGSVVSTFTAISSDITGTTSCDLSCYATDVYQTASSEITGSLDVTASNTVETRSGTLNVTWTPSD